MKQIAGFPVIDGEELVGILTESDILRMAAAQWGNQPTARPPESSG